MIGLIVLAIVIVLYFMGIVGTLSITGAVVLAIGSFGALIYDGRREKWKRAGFVILSIAGIIMIVYDVVVG